jgi:hypothetical protein
LWWGWWAVKNARDFLYTQNDIASSLCPFKFIICVILHFLHATTSWDDDIGTHSLTFWLTLVFRMKKFHQAHTCTFLLENLSQRAFAAKKSFWVTNFIHAINLNAFHCLIHSLCVCTWDLLSARDLFSCHVKLIRILKLIDWHKKYFFQVDCLS